ncbi:MAG TPA: hypothetical protein VF765_27435 [Polyangiaceae bacterium]
MSLPVALLALPMACATSGDGNSASSGEGGDEGSVEGGEGSVGEGGVGEGGGDGGTGGTSAAKACADNASHYCTQLSMCSPFLLSIQYGDEITCETEVQPGCLDALAAPGTGWTGDKLETCVTARDKLSCEQFFYAKPYPNVCMPSGKLGNAACRYDAQCGTGYCRIPSGMMCGTCVSRGATGALCQTSDDCDGNLMCAMGTCAAPSMLNGPCSATTPCAQGLQCVGSVCVVAGGVDGGCGDAGGVCDYNLGAVCTGNACGPVAVDTAGGSCSGPPMDQCPSSSVCSQGFCTPPIGDMMSCDAGSGIPCTPPDTCNMGTCSLFTASQCK